MIVEYEDCDCTLDNFWENLKTIDPFHDLKLNCAIMSGFFSNYDENKNKTLKDFELELRKHNLDVGLIAAELSEHMVKAVSDKKLVVIKPQYMDLYVPINDRMSDIKPEHIAKYQLLYSCRPREYVIKETLENSKSIEENLEKLLDCGVCVCINEEKISPDDIMMKEKEKDTMNELSKGKKLLKLRELDLEKEFSVAYEKNKDAEMVVVGMKNNGGPILALSKDGRIVSNVGIHIYHDADGNKVHEYMII